MKRRRFLRAVRDGLLLAQCAGLASASRSSSAAATTTVTERPIRIFLAGDVMLGRGIDQVLPNPGSPVLHEDYVRDATRYVSLAERRNGRLPDSIDYRYVWGGALEILEAEQPDLRVVNLETSITTSDAYWAAKGIHYRMHPMNVPCLTAAGIDCCVVANNHVMDWGLQGLEETLATLHAAGIATAGAGADSDQAFGPARFRLAGGREIVVFGLADTSSGVPAGWRAAPERPGIFLLDDLSEPTALKTAARIREMTGPDDVVIVSIHWGSNWGYTVPRDQRRFARRLVDLAHVAVIHGHSSHHPRPVEMYDGSLILYGCGDFINDYEGIGGHEEFRPWLSCLYLVAVDAASRRPAGLQIVPLRMSRFSLTEASADDRQWLFDKLGAISEDFGTRLEVKGERLFAFPAEPSGRNRS
jgi:poly-gamma-glutamate synthesis protein (capsule biosynthesis protein)